MMTISLVLFLFPGKAAQGGRWADIAQETFDVLDEWKELRNITKDLPFAEAPEEVMESIEREVDLIIMGIQSHRVKLMEFNY